MATINSWNNQIAAAITPITLNSGTNAVNISTDAAATTVNFATGGGVKTVTLGSTNSTSTTNLQAGSGGIKIPAFAEGVLTTSSSGVISTVTGTSTYVLTANTAGTAPSFKVFAPAGVKTLIQTQTVSGASTVDFTTGITGYTYYILEALNYSISTANQILRIFLSSNAGSSWTSYGSAYFQQANQTGASTFRGSGGSLAGSNGFALLNGFQGTTSGGIAYSYVKLFGFDSSSINKQAIQVGVDASNNAVDREQLLHVAESTTTTVVNGVRCNPTTGTVTGTFRLFGVM